MDMNTFSKLFVDISLLGFDPQHNNECTEKRPTDQKD